jgi:hypothetical protein
MFETLLVMPIGFWAVIALLISGFYYAATNVRQGLGIPAATLFATIAFWYVGDALYNDYRETHMFLFTPEVLALAWWQVALFLTVFLLITPLLHRRLNGQLFGHSSQALHLFKAGVKDAQFQRTLTILYSAAAGVWLLLLGFATLRFGNRFIYYLFPYLGEHPGPWVSESLAFGVGDSLLALANNLQLMVGCLFGVIAALSTNSLIRSLALIGVFLTWPYFIFGFVRNHILVTVVPGLLAWVLLRLRFGIFTKVIILAALFLLVNAWFGFIIGHRAQLSTTAALKQEGFNYSEASKQEHEGLNMFEELCWINSFIKTGSFKPTLGYNYFANFANPIPRFLWPGKPSIGLDYANARGGGGADNATGVFVTLSDGMIGQGVNNFGIYIGPAFAAFLISLWVCWVARCDLLGRQIGYFPLYGLGLILTFIMGRDIGPLAMYPFFFGSIICWWLNRNDRQRLQSNNSRRKLKRSHKRRSRGNSPTIDTSNDSASKTTALPSQADG